MYSVCGVYVCVCGICVCMCLLCVCVRSLNWEDPLEKGMATHSSILTWRIPWTEEPGRLQSTELQRVRHN